MAFFKEVMGIQLPGDIIQEVTARTEGWLVGLQLLGLSLQGHIDPANLLDEVNGTATDEKGGQYIFVYANTSVFDSGAIFPQPLVAYTFKGPDLFQLIATTPGSPTYTVNIYFNARINADGSFTDLGTAASQDPNCDPI